MIPTQKLIGSEDERAVSPVIGVILMVAITVILAAVIAAFVLDIGDAGAPVQGNVDADQNEEDLTLTVTDAQSLDGILLRGGCVDGEYDLTADDDLDLEASTGSTDTVDLSDGGNFTDCNDGSSINIVGQFEDSESVLRTVDIEAWNGD